MVGVARLGDAVSSWDILIMFALGEGVRFNLGSFYLGFVRYVRIYIFYTEELF